MKKNLHDAPQLSRQSSPAHYGHLGELIWKMYPALEIEI